MVAGLFQALRHGARQLRHAGTHAQGQCALVLRRDPHARPQAGRSAALLSFLPDGIRCLPPSAAGLFRVFSSAWPGLVSYSSKIAPSWRRNRQTGSSGVDYAAGYRRSRPIRPGDSVNAPASCDALLADIGGTNARFALARQDSRAPLLMDSVREFAVADFPSLAHAAQHYLDSTGTGVRTGANALAGVFAVAGRVDGDEARITNHPWVISAQRTGEALGLRSLRLVNDFAAQAMAASLFTTEDVVPI